MTKLDNYVTLAMVLLGLYSFFVGYTEAKDIETLIVAMLFALIGVGGGAFILSQSPSSK
jgi:hypothetical protein